jgi:hypothetical protein
MNLLPEPGFAGAPGIAVTLYTDLHGKGFEKNCVEPRPSVPSVSKRF